MRTIASWTIKGGVGKTAAAVNLAHAAALRGRRTLLWDLDPQAATSFYLRVPPICGSEFDNLFILPADLGLRHLDLELDGATRPRRRLRTKLEPLADRFDIVIIDCPPSVSLVSEAVLCAADAVLVPVIPSTLSLRTLGQVQGIVAAERRHRPLLMPFLSMVDRRKTMHREVAEMCLARPDFLRTAIPTASVVEKMGLTRAPVAATLPSHPAARAFTTLWAEVEERLATCPP
jgi:chromosome partitioning protein